MDEREWDRLVEQLQEGDCTPFLGAGASSPTLPTGGDLGRRWATKYGYPLGDGSNLPEVMQYASVIEGDPVTIKRRVANELSSYGEPNYTDPTEPHALLAKLPLRTFLTTNYDSFMTRALERNGKRPVTAVCPWYGGAEDDPGTSLPPDYEPRRDDPLVYHLHGRLEFPASLVLTERDYVEFLVNIAKDVGAGARRVVPHQVLLALTRQPLLFIGYSLRDWNFRTLFQGFVGAMPDVQRRRHISVQLKPDGSLADDGARHRAEEYLTRYYEGFNIAVYWGSAKDFCTELHSRLGSG